MDIIQFQNKLKEVRRLAEDQGKKVTRDQVREIFPEEELEQDKLGKVYDYLEVQGIFVEGKEKKAPENKGEEPASEEKVLFPLTEEELEYLEEYRESMAGSGRDLKTLFAGFFRGEKNAKEELVRGCQELVISMAKELNREEIFFGDLLQEGNMGLLDVLSQAEEGKSPEETESEIGEGIRRAMELFLREQTQQKKEDEILVEKVRNLEARVKELTEDGEDVKYSVEELALFLDMDQEEMEAVLRLTGDDKD